MVKGPGQVGRQHQRQAWKRRHMAQAAGGTERPEQAAPTYRTLYTPQAAPCTWRDTVDKSIPPETDPDRRRHRRPGAWRRQQQPHMRTSVAAALCSGAATHAMLKDGLASWSVMEAVVC